MIKQVKKSKYHGSVYMSMLLILSPLWPQVHSPHLCLYSCPAKRFVDEIHSFILLLVASLCPGPGDTRWCPSHQELGALVGEYLSLCLSRKHLNINKIGTLIQEIKGDGRAEKPTGHSEGAQRGETAGGCHHPQTWGTEGDKVPKNICRAFPLCWPF